MYSMGWPRLRSVVADKAARYGPTHPPVSTSAITSVSGSVALPALAPSPAQVIPDPESIADRALVAIHKLFRVQGSFARSEGDHLEFLLRTHAYRGFGYSSFGDFVREELQMSSRTAARRVALSRTLRENEILSRAVNDGRLSPCQALALEPMKGSAELREWIKRAAQLTVHDLISAIRGKQAAGAIVEPDEDPPGRTVTFGATASAAYVWDHAIELARRVLGWEAPVYRCIEAVLAEAATDLCTEGSSEMPQISITEHLSRSLHASKAGDPKPALQWNERFEALVENIVIAEEELRILQEISGGGPQSAERSLGFVRSLKRRERRFRILFAQILQDADAAGVIAFWGYRCISDFLIEEIKVSERTAKRYMSEAWTFDGNSALCRAYYLGRIGLGQAYLVNRVASTSTLTAFIRRAEVVTHLHFEREVLFLERLAEYWPTLARRFPGPLPTDMLEPALREGLKELGWSAEDIEHRFGPVVSGDPAANPMIMGSLESLLECFVLALEERDMAVHEAATLASEGDGGSVSTSASMGVGPASFAGDGRMSTTLTTTGSCETTISFWAPEPLILEWNEAIKRVQARHGPIPTWAAAIFILQIAVREWERLDPKRRPAEWRILERDRWRCQAPGCSARRRLEVHHIIFRSRGGTDAPENLTTLCHAHHQHGIHGDGLHLEGSAPGGLRWRLGKGKWFHGSRRTQGPFKGLLEEADISENTHIGVSR